MNRLRKISNIYKLLGTNNDINIEFNEEIDLSLNQNEIKKKIYLNNLDNINIMQNAFKTFLSKVDLENDLNEVIPEEMREYLNTDDAVEYLQKNKMKNMAELVIYLKEEDLTKIIEHPNFKCLKEFVSYE